MDEYNIIKLHIKFKLKKNKENNQKKVSLIAHWCGVYIHLYI